MSLPNFPAARRDSIVQITVIAAAFAPFMASLFYGFVYDDTGILLHNPVIDGWHALIEVWRHPYWANNGPEKDGLYRPLLMAIFALIWNGARKFAVAFHLFVVAMHVVTSLLVWRLLRRAVAWWAAAAAALWFALHPVHVEAVANISNGSEVLVGFWTLLLVQLLSSTPTDSGGERLPAPRGWRIVAAAAAYAVALLTKESGAVSPALALVALAWWQKRPIRRWTAQLRDWAPLLAAWTAVAVLIAAARAAVLGGIISRTSIAAPGLQELSATERIVAMLSLGGRVAKLLFWPGVQNPHYGPSVLPATQGITPAAATVGAFVALFAGLLIFARRTGDARPLAALVWCCLAFLPASNLLTATGQILAERTLYVSSIGAAMLLAWALTFVGARVRAHPAIASHAGRTRAGAVLTAGAIAAICARSFIHTRDYTRVWKNHQLLFGAMIAADSSSYRGYQLLALEAKRVGDSTTAARLYARAYALYPTDRILAADYGEYLIATRQTLQAIPVARGLMTHPDMLTKPRAVTLLLNAISLTWGLDSLTIAARELNAAHPSATSALFVGLTLETRGDSASALVAYREGLRLAPNDSALSARVAALRRRL